MNRYCHSQILVALIYKASFWCLILLPFLHYAVRAQDGFQWIPVNDGLEGDTVPLLWRAPSGVIFAGGQGGLFRSEGYMQPWNATNLVGFNIGDIMMDSSGVLWAGTSMGIYHSSDGGFIWTQIGYTETVYDLAISKSGAILGATEKGIISQDPSSEAWFFLGQWRDIEDNSFQLATSVAVTADDRIWATVGNFVYYTESGSDWFCLESNDVCVDGGEKTATAEAVGSDLLFSIDFLSTFRFDSSTGGVFLSSLRSLVRDYAHTDSSLYAITKSKNTSAGSFPKAIFRSKDLGKTWELFGPEDLLAFSIAADKDDKWVCIGQSDGIWCSEDEGESWNPWNEGMFNAIVPSLFTTSNGNVLAGAITGAYLLDVGVTKWNRLDLPNSNQAVHTFAQSSSGAVLAISGWFFRSRDDGSIWERLSPNFEDADKYRFDLGKKNDKQNLTITSTLDFSYQKPCPFDQLIDFSPVISWTDTLAYVVEDEFRLSDNDWDTFYEYDSITEYGDKTGMVALIRTPQKSSLLVGGKAGLLLRSEDAGVSWSRSQLTSDPDLNIHAFILNTNNSILAATSKGFYLSEDDGYLWEKINTNNIGDVCINSVLADRQGTILADGGYISNDNGKTWQSIAQPPAPVISTTFDSEGVPYVGTLGLGVFKGSRPLSTSSDIPPTHLTSIDTSVFPNPTINGQIEVKIKVPELTNISIEVFDTLGRKQQTLYNNILMGGLHNLSFSISKIASGQYIVRIKAGEYQFRHSLLVIN